jgi:hypothetical protein
MAVTIKHAKTDTIADWTQSDLDAQIAAGNYPPGTVLADIVLPSDWNNDHTISGTLAIANGGTGQTTANAAFNALAPSQTSNAGKVLTTDGTNTSWVTNGSGTVTSVTGTAPVSVATGTTTPVISMAAATSAVNGYLTSTDWTTFNSKAPATSGTSILYGNGSGGFSNVTIGTGLSFSTGTLSATGSMVYPGAGIPNSTGSAWGTSYGTTGANSVVLRDANQNITINSSFNGFTSVAASGTQITLTATSTPVYLITGSGGQVIQLPNATTLPLGAIFSFNNNQSSGAITVNNASTTLVASVPSGGYTTIVLTANGTSAGTWDRHDQSPSNVSWSTNTFDYSGSITSATWNGNVVAYNRGGTGQSSAFVAGGVVYGSSTSALAVTPIGTSGQVLTSNGAGTPTWTTPTTGTVTSVTGTAPIASSGGATPAISISQATTSTNGYLSSTDWNTFNGKQTAYTNLSTFGALANSAGWLYNNGTGTLSYSTPTAAQVGAVPTTRSLTINGTAYDLSADRTWSVGTVTSVAALTLGTSGTDLSSTVATGTTTPVITLNVPTASATNRGALSAADWTTFNNKGSGSVTTVSVASANGFAGTVANASTTPAITLTTSISGVLKGSSSALAAATAGTDFVAPGTATTFTATQTFNGSSSTLAAVFANAAETTTVSATAATGTINFDVTTQSVLYYTTNASANFTMNFRGSSGTSLNTAMATGQTVTVVFLNTNGSTAYYNNAVTIDGNSVTPKYQGGSAWTSGNASAIDAYSFTIIKTGSAAFTVLTSQTQFK